MRKPGPMVRLSDVRAVLTAVYAVWHRCGLPKPERGMKAGRLCDVCLEVIAAHLKTLKTLATR